MQSLSSSFASFSNKKNNRTGHLFQGRYRAKLIQNEKYLLELCYYIHFNPLKAKMVADINEYLWSSHSIYSGNNIDSWITTEYVQNILHKLVPNFNGENCYTQFINDKTKYLEATHCCDFDEDGLLIIKDSVNDKIRSIGLLTLRIFQFTKLLK